MDELEGMGVAFLSIRDGFDRSTPAGRLTLPALCGLLIAFGRLSRCGFTRH